MKANIVLLAGDGIGPEVVSAAKTVLDRVADQYNHRFIYQQHLIGGCSIDSAGRAITEEVIEACRAADAISTPHACQAAP